MKHIIADRHAGEDWPALMKNMSPANLEVVKKLITENDAQMAQDAQILNSPDAAGLLAKRDPKAVAAATRLISHHNTDWIGVEHNVPKNLIQFSKAIDALID